MRAGSVHVECDDDVTAVGGFAGVVTGIDPDKQLVAFVDGDGIAYAVHVSQLVTVNQQDTRPRAGKFDPPASPPRIG